MSIRPDKVFRNIAKSISPETVVAQNEEVLDSFIDLLSENSPISINMLDAFYNVGDVPSLDNVKDAFSEIYMNNVWTVMNKAQNDYILRQKLNNVLQDFLNIPGNEDYRIEDNVYFKEADRIFNNENIITNKEFLMKKGTKTGMEYAYKLGYEAVIDGDVFQGVNDYYFDFIESGNPWEYTIEGSMLPDTFNAFVRPLSHPVGFNYIYTKIFHLTFTDYYGVNILYYADLVEVVCKKDGITTRLPFASVSGAGFSTSTNIDAQKTNDYGDPTNEPSQADPNNTLNGEFPVSGKLKSYEKGVWELHGAYDGYDYEKYTFEKGELIDTQSPYTDDPNDVFYNTPVYDGDVLYRFTKRDEYKVYLEFYKNENNTPNFNPVAGIGDETFKWDDLDSCDIHTLNYETIPIPIMYDEFTFENNAVVEDIIPPLLVVLPSPVVGDDNPAPSTPVGAYTNTPLAVGHFYVGLSNVFYDNDGVQTVMEGYTFEVQNPNFNGGSWTAIMREDEYTSPPAP